MPIDSTRLGLLMLMMMFASILDAAPVAPEKGIAVVPDEANRRVDVLVDGRPFTSYIWPESLKVPTLWPLRTADGTPITRGFPLEPRAGERVDHPHHAGFWLNYGNVNGVDFWNNSTVISLERQAKMGTVLHRRIVKTSSGADKGELDVETDWVMPGVGDGGMGFCTERRFYVPRHRHGMREVDRVSTLTALDKVVSFKDDKEGMLGLRVRKELEQPTKDSVVHTDAAGKPTTQKSVDNVGVSGQYR